MHNRLFDRWFQTFFDDPASGGGGTGTPAPAGSGGAPTPSGTPASPPPPVTPPAAPGAPGGPGSGTPTDPAAAAAAAARRRFEYDAEYGGRADWIDPQRYRQTELAARRAAAEAERYRRMIEAGTGVRIPGTEPEMPREIAEARSTFAQIFPGLAQIEAIAPRLMQMLQALPEDFDMQQFGRLPDMFASGEHYWESLGQRTIDALYGTVAKDLGVEELTPMQRTSIGNTFMSWLQMDPQRAQRYTQGNSRVVDEFLTDWRSGFIEPIRRTAQAGDAATAARNRSLPPAPRGSGIAPPAGTPPPDPKTIDQANDAAWEAFKAARAATG